MNLKYSSWGVVFFMVCFVSNIMAQKEGQFSYYEFYKRQNGLVRFEKTTPYDYHDESTKIFKSVKPDDFTNNVVSYTQDSFVAILNTEKNIDIRFGGNADRFEVNENQVVGGIAFKGYKGDKLVFPDNIRTVKILILTEVNDAEILLTPNDGDRSDLVIDELIILDCKNIRRLHLPNVKVKKRCLFQNCSFDGQFVFSVDSDSLDKVYFESCNFTNINDFTVGNHGNAHFYYRNCLWPEKMRFQINWDQYSKAAYPKDFFHYPLRRVDTLFSRFTPNYDMDIPAEENKTMLYRECMGKLRRYQRYAADYFDFELADSIYRTSKDLETYYYKYLDEKNSWSKDFTTKAESWIYYRFNSFMGWFCGYGTLPIDSIYNSVYIILTFALFYIIFPTRMKEESDAWDFEHLYVILSLYSGQNAPLDTFFRAFQQYKSNNPHGGIRQFLESHTKENLIEFRNNLPGSSAIYIDAIINSYNNKSKILRLFLWFYAYPFLMQVKIIHLLDQLGEERRLYLSKKGIAPSLKNIWSLKLSLSAGIFFLYWMLLRIPQGLFISINAFSTLGFGHLPLRGICKYLGVIEGLIGWFTLSLFSITYVNILMR